MSIKGVPDWMMNLEDEDVKFIKKFILNSGSLKKMAQEYEVTYPTVRLRLDKLIQKIESDIAETKKQKLKRKRVNTVHTQRIHRLQKHLHIS